MKPLSYPTESVERMIDEAIGKERQRCVDIVVAVSKERCGSPHASAALAEVAHKIVKGAVANSSIGSIACGEWVRLDALECGSIFETRDGVRAVKSEYHYDNGAPQCVLLASGEYAHFPGKGLELVREIRIEGVTP